MKRSGHQGLIVRRSDRSSGPDARDRAKGRVRSRVPQSPGLFELLWPDEDLKPIRDDYRWLAKVYQSIQPAVTPDALLWHRLGAKTLALIDEHIVRVDVRGAGVERVTMDEETLDALRKLGVGEPVEAETPPTADEMLDSIEKRIEKRLKDSDDPTYSSLADRLDKLRQTQIESAADSIEFLKHVLEIARDLVAADRDLQNGDEIDEPTEEEQISLLPDERLGALTQILDEFKPDVTPEIIERVVKEIDAVVLASRFTRWQSSRKGVRTVKTEIRKALKKFGLPVTGEL